MKKKLILIIIASFWCFTTINAQLIRGYGIKVGTVSANQTWNYTTLSDLSTESRWGLTLSGFVEVLDIPYFSIVAELQYAQKGTKILIPETGPEDPAIIGTETISPRVDYLSIPILVKIRFSNPLIEPYIMAGPRVDVLLSKSGDAMSDVVDKFKSSDYGLTVGVGAEIGSWCPLHLLAEVRYNTSLNKAYDSDGVNVRNESLDLIVGIRF